VKLGEHRDILWSGDFPLALARAQNGLVKVLQGKEYVRNASTLEIYLARENRLLADRVRGLQELIEFGLAERRREAESPRSWVPRRD